MGGPGPVQRREEILDAARAVLGQHGYERTTVSAIAQRASVAQGTFYLYFPSKEALPGALAEKLSSEMRAAAEHAAEEADVHAGVDALLAGSLSVAQRFSDVFVVVNRGIELCEEFDRYRSVTEEWVAGLETFLRRFQGTGEVAADLDVEVTALVLRDVVDRAMKAQVLWGADGYADATRTLVRRALAC